MKNAKMEALAKGVFTKIPANQRKKFSSWLLI
jgi:hypothetical protein